MPAAGGGHPPWRGSGVGPEGHPSVEEGKGRRSGGPSAYKEKGRFFGAVRGLSDKKLRLGVDFWCDYYIMVEEWNYSEGSIFCQTYYENEKLRTKYDR